MYADHEAVNRAEVEPLVSHYNNQYDAIARLRRPGSCRPAITGGGRSADDLAAHVADIDLYHTTDDRAAYNGGYFWHTEHYQPARHRHASRLLEAQRHRRAAGRRTEHNYTTGLMLHYFLTGSERSRAAVIQLADWVIDMDDGAQVAVPVDRSPRHRAGERHALDPTFTAPAAAPAIRSTRCSTRIG